MFEDKINKIFNKNEPIFIEEILEAIQDYSRAYTFRQIKKMEQTGSIVRFTQGVYYLPNETEFGKPVISIDDIVKKKYIQDKGETFGVYSGLVLQNMFGVTTQVPNVLEIVTNKESTRCRKITLEGREFILRKARVNITKENANAYMILQLFSEIKDASYMDERGIITPFGSKNDPVWAWDGSGTLGPYISVFGCGVKGEKIKSTDTYQGWLCAGRVVEEGFKINYFYGINYKKLI